MVSTNSTLNLSNPWQQLQKLLPSRRRRVKTPTLLQMEAVECGAATLGIIMYYLGQIVPLPELRRECGVSRDGSKASNMLKAARRYGLEAKGFKKELAQLRELPLPYIVFWNFNHFLVVEGWGKEKVYLNDPATGPCTVSLQEFDEAYTGVVLVIQPGKEFKKGGRKASMLLAIWSRLKGTTGALAYCMLAGFLLTLVGLVVPVFTQVFIDEILIQGRQHWLRPLLLAMAIAAIFQCGLTLLRLRYLRRLKIKLAVGMSSRFLWHILRLPVSFYAQRFAGEISNRTNLNNQVADILSGQLATTIIDTVMLGFYVIVMSQYDLVLTVIVFGFAAINVITLQKISRQRKDANQRLIQDYGKAAGTSIAALQSIENIKASGLESDIFARWSGYYTKAINSQQELGVTNQTLSVLPVLLSSLSTAFLLAVGGLRVMDGHLSIGMLVAFQSMMVNFQQPVNNLVSFGRTLQELDGNLIRLDDVLDNPTDTGLEHRLREANNREISSTPKLEGHLELKDLTFGYSRLEAPLVENFSLKLKPGQRVALVGGSGSGKSTVAKLVSGLYEPWSGEILLDNQPKSLISNQLLTNSLAMVEQDILMFSGTVRDNLTLWDTTIPDKYIKQACQDALIDDVVQSLPGGYNAELLEGAANLSGGQRQRLEIARALVNNPSILIMDEATSALDAETEKMVDHNLRRRGCTCLIVAHRLSTIRDCDEIIVLDRGKIVQRGTHEELSPQKGIYARLIKSGLT
ncbi:NHLP family bacteriocin export ABC transporter peptidase/permease/ATPase subunit [Pleurocapsa sp. PCC 7319]|uniref:NHLP family bacteriocin export ABC transporter peptidase/permease/ATPase subunit n=1 Tax=Pleurocapsa sp. PCC 7319 TaxID=118161 RepID=UPI00034C974D|nr:NHLP family bacteriocin export ABC transporter peptidase/permease/ATPase subunit [Pleurocapsa sp. PCC 7319]